MYSVFLSAQAQKFLGTCENRLKRQLDELFSVLTEDPLPIPRYDIAKIRGLKKGYRIRLGTIRVIIELNPRVSEVYILKIDKRGKVYRDL